MELVAFNVKQVLDWSGGRLVNSDVLGSLVDQIRVSKPSILSTSQASDLSFFFSRNYEKDLPVARPGILITGEPFVEPLKAAHLALWKTSAVIACQDPYFSMAVLSEKFASLFSTVAHTESQLQKRTGEPEIHSTAVVASSAILGAGVKIGSYCVVEEHVQIGSGTLLYPGCFVGSGAVIGRNCVLFPRVTIYEWTEIGNQARIHSGVVIGADGFGYAPKREGDRVVQHQKIYHLGRVVIGDNVEIGANSCIDRATFGDTKIGKNSKIDNMVQIGHNCELDEGAIICGGVGIAGNASVGKYAYVLGNSGLANQVHVGDGAFVGAHTLVSKDVPPGAEVVGNPQRGRREHFKAQAILNKLIAERDRRSK